MARMENIMRKVIYCIFLLPLLGGFTLAQATAFDHSHAPFDKVLQRFLHHGLVDYAGLKSDPRDLAVYLDQLAAVSQAEFQKWTEPQQLAFLINLYNATTLQLILDHYPTTSIKKIGNVVRGPWDQPIVRLFGETTTLDRVEHKILRKNYAEPRVHFALVCAALGCPVLREETYTAEKLDRQLTDQGRRFLGNAQKNRVDAKARVVYLSPIFKWFSEDFEKKSGSVLKFVQLYFPPEAQAALEQGSFKIRYTDYDWSLNDTAAARK